MPFPGDLGAALTFLNALLGVLQTGGKKACRRCKRITLPGDLGAVAVVKEVEEGEEDTEWLGTRSVARSGWVRVR